MLSSFQTAMAFAVTMVHACMSIIIIIIIVVMDKMTVETLVMNYTVMVSYMGYSHPSNAFGIYYIF